MPESSDESSSEGEPDMSEFKVIYEGDQHDIRADVLLDSIGSVTDLVSTINSEVGGGRDIKIRISAPERGSFGIDLTVLTDIATTVMSEEVVTYTGSLVGTMTGLYELHKHLFGEDPDQVQEDGNDVHVENRDGDVKVFDKTVVNIYNGNDDARDDLDGTYESTLKDDRVEGIRIEDSETGEEKFRADREEFDELSGGDREDELEEREVQDRVTLTVVRVIFDPNRKWEFLLDGEKISAKIEDIGFWARVNNLEEEFSSSDRMEVELVRSQKYDPSLEDWSTEEYTIVQVYDHWKAGGQQGDFFDEDDE